MTDVFDRKTRSRVMSSVRREDTSPELTVRRALHAAGYRYRLHVKSLPGTPDIVLPRHQTVVMVHGCFWHGHRDCRRSALPSSNTEFWQEKIKSNRRRDVRVVQELEEMGWRVLVIWECETRKPDLLNRRIQEYFRDGCGDENG